MFDVGFGELLVIFAIALVVLGPEKLPRLAAQIGKWVGRARAMARQFREQLEQEANIDYPPSRPRPTTQTRPDSEPQPPPDSTTPQAAAPAGETPQRPNPDSADHAQGASAANANPVHGNPTDDTFSHAHGSGESEPREEHPAVTESANERGP
jgi:sec-independent protein translocase protein TatB